MPAKDQPSSRTAIVRRPAEAEASASTPIRHSQAAITCRAALLLLALTAGPGEPAAVPGFQAVQAPALDRALRANDLDQARRVIPENWAASEQLFVSYLERAFLSPDSSLPAPESRVLASRLADVFFRMVEYDFARSVIAALDTADTTRRQALIETVRDYYAALERVRANSIVLTLTPGLPPQQQRDESESRQLATRRLASQLTQVADRFRSLACPRCELHTLRSMINTGGEPRPRVDEVAAQLGDDLSLARKRPYTEASLALAERLGLPRTECAVLESLGILPSTVTDPAKLQQAARHLERGRSLLQSVPAREQVNYWLFTSLAPRLSTVVLPELWRLYHRLGRSSEGLRQLLAEALELSRPFGERAVMATLNSFASRAVNIGGDAGEPILEASRAFGPKAELATMRTLSGSYSTRTFRPDVAERPLSFAVASGDAHERAVTLEWYAANRAASPKCAPAPAAYEQLLQLCLKSDEHGLVAEALARDAYCLAAEGDTAQALALYDRAIGMAERAGGPLRAAQLIYSAVTTSMTPPMRFDLATRGIEYAKKVESPLELARAYRLRSQAPRGATNQSFDDLQAALAAAEQHTAQSGLVGEELECLRLLAVEHSLRGEFQAAADLHVRRAAKARDSGEPSSSRHVLGADEELARLYSTNLGEPTLALEAADRVRLALEGNLLDATRPATPNQYADVYIRLGELAATLGQPVSALDYWEKGLSKAADVSPSTAMSPPAYYRRRILTARAAQYLALGDFEASLRDREEIATLIPLTTRNWVSPETLQRAGVAADVAWTHALAGNVDRARSAALEALALYRADQSGKWPGLPLIDRMVKVLLATNQAQEAIAFCVSAHQNILREPLDQPVVERIHREHLARAHWRAGQYDQARSLLLAAVDIDREQPTAEVGGLGGSLLALGLLETDAGNFARARDYLLEARAAVNPYDTDRTWQIERALARLLEKLGDRDAAARHYADSLSALESVRERLRPEEFRLRYGFDRLSIYEQHAALLAAKAVASGRPTDADLAFQAAERKRTQILSELLATGWARVPAAALPDQLRRLSEVENRIGAKQTLLGGQFGQPADKRNTALLDTLQRELKELQSDHARLLVSVAQGQYRFAAPAALAASLAGPVRASLGPSRVLVEYLVADDRSFAFVVSGSGTKVVPLAVGRDVLRARVQELLRPFRQLRAGELDLARVTYDTRAAFALHQAIFAPVRPALGASTDVVIVPDDVLTFLPFEALVEQAPRGGPRGRVLHEELAGERYLLHRYAISYLSSSAQLLAGGAPAVAARSIFAMANPAAGRPAATASSQDDPLKRQLRSGTFDAFLTPLPGAEAEVERIVRHFSRDASTIVTGSAATEAAYEQRAGKHGVLHFATHAVASDGQPFYSTMIVAPDNAPGHDGFLQAFEVLRTPLQADLVVLSGCETALGAEDLGQGLVGLVAAFQQAGARSVLATLWSIDEATAEVMAGFYDAMASGASTPAALRQAKLQMLKQRLRIGQTDVSLAHPFFWAPFILVGAPAGR